MLILYSYIGWIYYYHNIKMGSWWTGLIMCSLWPIVAGLWIWGTYLVLEEDREMERLCSFV